MRSENSSPAYPNADEVSDAGRGLVDVEFNRGAVVARSAGVCREAAALAAVFATFTGSGWHMIVPGVASWSRESRVAKV